MFGCHKVITADQETDPQASSGVNVSDDLGYASSSSGLASDWYLRADYSKHCYDSEWDGMAAYSALWILVFVIAAWVFVVRQLHKFHDRQRATALAGGSVGVAPKVYLSFLADDYKPEYWWWEVRDMW